MLVFYWYSVVCLFIANYFVFVVATFYLKHVKEVFNHKHRCCSVLCGSIKALTVNLLSKVMLWFSFGQLRLSILHVLA